MRKIIGILFIITILFSFCCCESEEDRMQKNREIANELSENYQEQKQEYDDLVSAMEDYNKSIEGLK